MERALKTHPIVFVGIALFLISFVSLSLFKNAKAASTPQFLVTWKSTASYVPPGYSGKALPSYGSKVTADFELVSNGKILDLSDQTIYWYLNDTLIGGGVGVQQLTFPLYGTPPNSLDLRIELPTYDSNQYLIHTVEIPYANPSVVLYAPYPNGNFSTNPVDFTALPFFFNTSSSHLSYTWTVNGETGANAENPETAQITLPKGTASGASITVSIAIQGSTGSDTANTQSTLTYVSKLQ